MDEQTPSTTAEETGHHRKRKKKHHRSGREWTPQLIALVGALVIIGLALAIWFAIQQFI